MNATPLGNKINKVCVVGAGSSGLVAIKELLDEGIQVTCFEKYDQSGGNFYTNKDIPKSSAYDSTRLTVSNYMMAFSSFPPPLNEQRKFWTANEYQQYLQAFAQHYSLNQHITYNSEVIEISKLESGGFHVQVKKDDSIKHFNFDAIAICTGSSRVPKYIDLQGIEDFNGEIKHSAFYRNAAPFRGKRVLCIGMGETGVDVVNEIAGTAARCVLSLRHRQPVIERYPLMKPHTSDAYTSNLLYASPVNAANARMNFQFLLTKKFSKDKKMQTFADWNLKARDYYNHFNIKSEVFIDRIVENKLPINFSGIDHIGKDFVVFKDGQKEDIDAIIFNTGYQDQFAFIKNTVIPDVRQLYKHMIHPDLRERLVFIGWARPAVGGVPACSEMQSRYFSLLCSGKKVLPEDKILRRLISRQSDFENKVYHRNIGVRSLVHYRKYMNDFAKVIGCYPWIFKNILDPKLAYRLVAGSQMPYLYRLHGPHSHFEQARKTIFNVPIAFNPIEVVILIIFAVTTHTLAALRIITPDPKY